jgi:hypothetical protein
MSPFISQSLVLVLVDGVPWFSQSFLKDLVAFDFEKVRAVLNLGPNTMLNYLN